ncbi:hypothetical protein [Craterilacuibacter sp.]|uniref:hypothetical protein n=1 Tax=Craterilacuibacter sp. TaxID=2870909 RepID=UPI003F40184D
MKLMIAAKFLLRYAPLLANVLPRISAVSRGSWIKLGVGLAAGLLVIGISGVLLLVWVLQLALGLITDTGLWQSLSGILASL